MLIDPVSDPLNAGQQNCSRSDSAQKAVGNRLSKSQTETMGVASRFAGSSELAGFLNRSQMP
jgi:hypothetical protein